MKKPIAALVFLMLLVLMACSKSIQGGSEVIPSSTFTPISTATLIPTNTSLPLTATLNRVTELLPEGKALSVWNGIPIMPNATAGEGDEESYVFTVKATPEQVRDFYQLELGKLGWQPFATNDPDSPLSFVDSTSAMLTISMKAKGDETLVLLVK